jgi:hypothetical protein
LDVRTAAPAQGRFRIRTHAAYHISSQEARSSMHAVSARLQMCVSKPGSSHFTKTYKLNIKKQLEKINHITLITAMAAPLRFLSDPYGLSQALFDSDCGRERQHHQQP